MIDIVKLSIKLPFWWRPLLAATSLVARCGVPVSGDWVVDLITRHMSAKVVKA